MQIDRKRRFHGGNDGTIDEDRYVTPGLSKLERFLVVSHTPRGVLTRIISARPLTRQERMIYEDGCY
ncbi:MAG: BrnT family toxin [Syntrophobacteraceae bacterium]